MEERVKYWVEQENLSNCDCCPVYRYVVQSSQAENLFESYYQDEAEAECERLEHAEKH
jgi:hypothetical protein